MGPHIEESARSPWPAPPDCLTIVGVDGPQGVCDISFRGSDQASSRVGACPHRRRASLIHLEAGGILMCNSQLLRPRLFCLGLSLAVAAGGCGGGSGSDVAATRETPEFAKRLQE